MQKNRHVTTYIKSKKLLKKSIICLVVCNVCFWNKNYSNLHNNWSAFKNIN